VRSQSHPSRLLRSRQRIPSPVQGQSSKPLRRRQHLPDLLRRPPLSHRSQPVLKTLRQLPVLRRRQRQLLRLPPPPQCRCRRLSLLHHPGKVHAKTKSSAPAATVAVVEPLAEDDDIEALLVSASKPCSKASPRASSFTTVPSQPASSDTAIDEPIPAAAKASRGRRRKSAIEDPSVAGAESSVVEPPVSTPKRKKAALAAPAIAEADAPFEDSPLAVEPVKKGKKKPAREGAHRRSARNTQASG
jgi:hypothetical protein